ncbi:hypothetical protein [Luteimonas terrae]|uniref:Nuclear transport factor 2 family protein n=1 Tax=Luteimonas terrae TaxID=1530191 RepID=A0ABU1XZW9_9GAMM|nr:hypothetical protein [Luteimonas terrae]MDR7193571.1 hypothetical protein [Luteimonas terrae]
MIRILLLGMALVVGGVVAYEHGHRISESDVRAHMQSQLEATRRFDSDALCASMAKDYRLQGIYYVAGTQERRDTRRDETCRNAREGLTALQALSAQTGGLLAVDVTYEITRIELAPGGRRALVEATSTAKIGGRLLSRTRAKGQLSRAFWQVRDHGGEAQNWVYVH